MLSKISKIAKIRIAGSTIELKNKNSPRSAIETVYGVGRIKSQKIISILLTNPFLKDFSKNLVELSQELLTQRLFKSLVSDNQLKINVYEKLERKARIGCYRARRILQNLPSGGQRTHTNAGTPKTRNPFVSLAIKAAKTLELKEQNKKWELTWNNRSNDLIEFSGKAEKKKYSKKASLEKKKKKQEKEKRKAKNKR